jgi:hypothetical protein
MARITTHIARMPPNVSAATTGGKARVPGCQSVHNAAGGLRLASKRRTVYIPSTLLNGHGA